MTLIAIKRIFLGSTVLLIAATNLHAQAPATPALPADATVDQALIALEARGRTLKSMASDVTLAETDTELGSETSRRGTIALKRAGDDTTVRVTFTSYQSGNTRREERQDYLLTGPLLITRIHKTKTQNTLRVRRPGEKVDLLKLGEGPFPLPVGQPPADVQKEFDVTRVAPADDDLPNTVHLRLDPKDGTKLARKFAVIDVWIDTLDAFPRRIATTDANGTKTVTTTLSNLRLNADVNDEELKLETIGNDWKLEDETMRE